MTAMVEVSGVTYRYGERTALDDLSLSVAEAEVFALLGPNGSGKTTLFRLLSTLIPPQAGQVRMVGADLAQAVHAVRRQLGVVFQAASVDRKLSVDENLRHHGRLYGLTGRRLKGRCDEMLETLGLTDRRRDGVETLSGGLRRRVELAKALLPGPRLLLMDEPSTGLDPGARRDLWNYLGALRERTGVTIVLTTHLLDEADRADRLAILNEGRLVALGTPDELQASVGGDSITIETEDPTKLAAEIQVRFNLPVHTFDHTVRFEQAGGHEWIARLVEAFPAQITAITLGKPTLEDVFIARTGRRFVESE